MQKLRHKFNDRINDVLDGTHLGPKFSLMEASFVAVVMALMAVFGGFLYVHSVFSTDLDAKAVQVNSLITEVGDLKEENLLLYQQVLADQGEVNVLTETLEVLEQEIDVLSGEEIDIEGLLEGMRDLNSQLEEQKDIVESVVAEGSEFAKEAYVTADETFDVLILGTHGTLTDTIMVASVNPELETVSLISIPRDLSVGGRKINEYYNLYGAEQMKQAIYDILGILPEKYVVVDMQAFVDIVNAIGGIDINVEEELWDNQYPNRYGGYTTVYFAAGEQHMDGSDALMYARSRMTSSDFDRAERQQQVIQAVRDEVGEMDLIADPSAAVTIFRSILDNMDTDIGLFEGIGYYTDFGAYEIESGNVLSTGNYLYSTYNIYGQYILMPNGGDYSVVKEWVSGIVGN